MHRFLVDDISESSRGIVTDVGDPESLRERIAIDALASADGLTIQPRLHR